MDLLFGIFSAFGLSASAGLNAYIPLFVIAVIARYTDWFKLSAPFDALTNPWIVVLLGVLIIIEFLADKVPAINHVNDAIQTFVRPVAGAIAFAASAKLLTDISPIISLASGLIIAGGVHTVKAAALRPAVTATTGGAGNVPVSIAEDVVSVIASVLAIVLPAMATLLFFVLIIYFIYWLTNRSQQTTS